jgi:predicted  nucleic acid-binding Zn-ribbon protein
MQAIHLGQTLKSKLTSKETQDLLERLVEDKWISQESKGVYYLDTRAIAELQEYFRELYEDKIKECTICLDVVTMGEACKHCTVRLHKYCANRRFNNDEALTCPQCSRPWDRSHTFGLGLPNFD